MNDSIFKTLAVAFSVCLICSLVVSSSAVSLRDLQKENKLNDRRLKVLQVADIYNPDLSISEQFSQLESKFIDFDKGKIFSEYKNFNIDEYDQVKVTKDSSLSKSIPASDDIAIIKNRENVGKIYILRDDLKNIDKLILPIRGYGLWAPYMGSLLLRVTIIQFLVLNFTNTRKHLDLVLRLIIQSGKIYGKEKRYISIIRLH